MDPWDRLDWAETLERLASSGYRGSTPNSPFWLGDSSELSSKLLSLVVAGKKTATASLAWEWESENLALPNENDVHVLLNWENGIVGTIENVRVDVVPFNLVTEKFAALEGEGDLSLEYWRKVHWRFFVTQCQLIDKRPSEDMPIVCQQFRFQSLEIDA